MKPRRIALTVGAAGGGLLAAAFMPTAVASADDYSLVPSGPEIYTSLGGQPPVNQTVTGIDQLYDVNGTAGSFQGVSLNDVDTYGFSQEEILVAGPATGAAPPDGSFFDTFNYGHGFEQLYSDVVGTGGAANTITETLKTPIGNFNIPTTFDATDALSAAKFTYPVGSTTAGYSYVPTGPETINSLDALPGAKQLVSGIQAYDVDNPAGHMVGSFQGVSFNEVQSSGQTNEEILVIPNAVDPGPNDPPVGSVFDTYSYGFGFENHYSDVVGSDGAANTITDTLKTPIGDFNIPTTFDAAAASSAAEFTYPLGSTTAGYSYVPDPDSAESITSIEGQATPISQAITGTQLYDVNDPTGNMVGEFNGVSTNVITALGFTNQEILVTGDVPSGAGVSPDDPTAGSFFDTLNLGHGFYNVYSDVVGTDGAANTLTDTVVTPLGHFTLPVLLDATDTLPAAEFTSAGSTAAAELAAAMNPADFTGMFAELGTLWTSLF